MTRRLITALTILGLLITIGGSISAMVLSWADKFVIGTHYAGLFYGGTTSAKAISAFDNVASTNWHIVGIQTHAGAANARPISSYLLGDYSNKSGECASMRAVITRYRDATRGRRAYGECPVSTGFIYDGSTSYTLDSCGFGNTETRFTGLLQLDHSNATSYIPTVGDYWSYYIEIWSSAGTTFTNTYSCYNIYWYP